VEKEYHWQKFSSGLFMINSEWTVQFHNNGSNWPTTFRIKAIIPEN